MPQESATICIALNVLSLVGSVPVLGMMHLARTWGSPRENWGAFFLVFFGGAILSVQLLVLLVNGIVAIAKWKKWSLPSRWVFAAMLPLGSLISATAIYHGIPPSN